MKNENPNLNRIWGTLGQANVKCKTKVKRKRENHLLPKRGLLLCSHSPVRALAQGPGFPIPPRPSSARPREWLQSEWFSSAALCRIQKLHVFAGLALTTIQPKGFPSGSVVEKPPDDAGDAGSIPESGRSPGGGNGNPLQYSCLENPMDRRACGYSPQGCKELVTTEQA